MLFAVIYEVVPGNLLLDFLEVSHRCGYCCVSFVSEPFLGGAVWMFLVAKGDVLSVIYV